MAKRKAAAPAPDPFMPPRAPGLSVGLDFGTFLGFAIGDRDYARSGTVFVGASRVEPRAMRYRHFYEFVEAVILNPDNQEPITKIGYEMPFTRNRATQRMMDGFATRVHELCALHNVRYFEVHTNTLKKFATGHGRADKAAMLAAARAKWPGIPIKDDNEADARWILMYVESGLAESAQKARYQRLAELAQKVRTERKTDKRMRRVDRSTSSVDPDACAHDWLSDGTCGLCRYNPAEDE